MGGRPGIVSLALGSLLLAASGCEDRDPPTAPLASPTSISTDTPTATATASPTPTLTPTPMCRVLDVAGLYDAEWRMPECGRSGGPVRVVLTQTGCTVRADIPGLGIFSAVRWGTLAGRSAFSIALEAPCDGSVGNTDFNPRGDRFTLSFLRIDPFPAHCPGCVPGGLLTLTRVR